MNQHFLCTAPVIRLTGLVHPFGAPGTDNYFCLQVDRLEVFPGELLVILGPSGCGKTTLVHIVGLARRPAQVDEFVFTQPLDRGGQAHDVRQLYGASRHRQIEALRRQQVGHALQRPELLPSLTVKENIEIPLHLNHFPFRTARLTEILTAVSVSDSEAEMVRLQHRRPHELSGGQQQRVGLARSLAHKPALLVVDEPTSNLDPKTADRALQFLQVMRRRDNMAIVMVSHDEVLARRFADRIVRMEADCGCGRIVEEEVLRPVLLAEDFSIELDAVPPEM